MMPDASPPMMMTIRTFVSSEEKSMQAATARQTKTDVRTNLLEMCSRTLGMDSRSGTPTHRKAISEMTTAIAWCGSIIVKTLNFNRLCTLSTQSV